MWGQVVTVIALLADLMISAAKIAWGRIRPILQAARKWAAQLWDQIQASLKAYWTSLVQWAMMARNRIAAQLKATTKQIVDSLRLTWRQIGDSAREMRSQAVSAVRDMREQVRSTIRQNLQTIRGSPPTSRRPTQTHTGKNDTGVVAPRSDPSGRKARANRNNHL